MHAFIYVLRTGISGVDPAEENRQTQYGVETSRPLLCCERVELEPAESRIARPHGCQSRLPRHAQHHGGSGEGFVTVRRPMGRRNRTGPTPELIIDGRPVEFKRAFDEFRCQKAVNILSH